MAELAASKCNSSVDAIEATKEAAVSRVNHYQAVGLYDIAQQEVENLATTLFLVADGSKKIGCRKIADYYYRQILAIFTGTAYAAYRQRAMVGIEDVRRANISAPQNSHPRITEGVEAFEVTLSKVGMAGAKVKVEGCWSSVRQKWNRGDAEFCFGLDYTASGREKAAALVANFPRSEFFKSENVTARADTALSDLYPDRAKRKQVISEWTKAAQSALHKLVQ
jgi:hypothetical protein